MKRKANAARNRASRGGIVHAGFIAGIAVASAVSAQPRPAYPNKPIRLIVAYAPGGGNDIVARLIAPPLTASFGQQIVVENRSGGGGTVGAALAAKAEADGYTIFVSSLGTHAVGPNLFRNPGYDPINLFSSVDGWNVERI